MPAGLSNPDIGVLESIALLVSAAFSSRSLAVIALNRFESLPRSSKETNARLNAERIRLEADRRYRSELAASDEMERAAANALKAAQKLLQNLVSARDTMINAIQAASNRMLAATDRAL